MESAPEALHTRYTSSQYIPVRLLQLLSNSLVLYQTAPHLPLSSLLALGATSRSFKALLNNNPAVFRYLDLSRVKSIQPQARIHDPGHVDANITEDEFYGRLVRGGFDRLHRRHILQHVQTLVLDGLSVPSDLVGEIILDETFNVRILSLREVKNLNEPKLQQALQYVVRRTRPPNTPKLRGLYIFGRKDAPQPWQSTHELGNFVENSSRDKWYQKSGQMIACLPSINWAHTLMACLGIISFDAVLCNSPWHPPMSDDFDSQDRALKYSVDGPSFPPQLATHAVQGCRNCHSSPEGFAVWENSSLDCFPLLAPVPLHSSTIKAAKTPTNDGSLSQKKLLLRCVTCLRNRYCESCCDWWCEDCYDITTQARDLAKLASPSIGTLGFHGSAFGHDVLCEQENQIVILRSCIECGYNCTACVDNTQLLCKFCRGRYCKIHNEGSTLTTCDWCESGGRRRIHLL